MKKILFAISMMFVLAACSHDNIGVEPNPEEGAVLVNFSVQVPEMQVATRLFTDPKITSLHLLVFDENGYFVQAAEATGTFGVVKDTEYNFSASLMQSPYKRVVHFIANSPISDYEYGSETALINALTTSGSQDAYWQRVELPNGILEGNQAMATAFTEVPLVRNFVKISVDIDNQAKTIFDYEGIAVINVPDMGTVAPFNVNNGTYATYSAGIAYKTLNDAGYYGYEPSDMKIVNTDTSNPTFATEHYIYERRQNQDDKDYTYVIIEGKYNNSETSTYYKVDIVDDKKEPYNLLRNFNYVIKINSVLGPGYESADAAAKAAASNNISASIDTKNLLNISDGSSRLYVEYVNKVITKPGTFTLKYKYLPNISDNTQTNYNKPANDDVDLINVEGDVIASYSTASSDDASDWRTITFTTPATITETKLQTITIKAGVLQREINLILCKPFVLNVTSTPTGSAVLNADATVTLGLPAGLPAAIFPLEFVIVETGLSISPDASKSNNNLPVRTSLNVNGQTVSGGQYFGFVKKVEYSDYNPTNSDTPAAKDIVCYFKLNKAITSGLNVNVYNEYFE
ncbi:MAG: membrane lipoprotein lipid attachment site-containing protein [Alistipes sp.]|nr:membrane lipoprotein lipid attachment site-containing protein [Alistipes sp.]